MNRKARRAQAKAAVRMPPPPASGFAELAAVHGFDVLVAERTELRRDQQQAVEGLAFALRRTDR
jgi:hypothetical protein